jgi:pyruvate/2-oxoglutarate dehydrogenase complex dihydrolipoamide dehydrogenase (E3) component
MDDLYALAIVGAGLSALSAIGSGIASQKIIVIDYQEAPGGFLKDALHAHGFEEATDLIKSFRVPSGVTTSFRTSAMGLLPAFEAGEPHTLIARRQQGTMEIRARRILIASGGLELTREHAQIPGTRPAGVITPILAHQLLSQGYLPGKRAVIYGDSCYTLATARRLAASGVEVTHVGLYAELVEIQGFPRLEVLSFRRDGRLFNLAADTLIYAVGMMANTHWLKGSGITTEYDGTIEVDGTYQTNIPGIFAIGTVVSPSLDHTDSIAMGKEVASLPIGGFL